MARPYPAEKIDRVRRLYETHGVVAAAQIARVSENGIRLMKRRGWTVGQAGPTRRPMPNDFQIQSAAMGVVELARHYSAGLSTVARWSAAIARQPLKQRDRSIPVPANMIAVVRAVGPARAAMKFGVSEDTLRKWRRAAGLPIARGGRISP